MSYTLRPYQNRAQSEIFDWFHKNKTGNPIVNACVGSGKSLLIADFCLHVLNTWPDQRIIMIVSSRELVRQNYEKLLAIWPQAPVGVYSSGLNRRDIFQKIIFASIGSIHKRAKVLGFFDIGLVDECHNINPKKMGMYRNFISDMEKINPLFRVIGYTGTPWRGNGVWLHKAKDSVFSDICTNIRMRELLDDGYLCPLVIEKTDTVISAKGIQKTNFDYNLKQLAQVTDKDEITRAVVDEIIHRGRDRHCWVTYCVNKVHATHVYLEFMNRGIPAGVITEDTPKKMRDQTLKDSENLKIKVLVNCEVLTVGWDNPRVDLIALLRNTESYVLYPQIAGRGMRTHIDKNDCLWLDFTDTTSLLGPVDQITGRNPINRKIEQGAPTKECPKCGEINLAGVRNCCNCDYEFPVSDLKINDFVSNAPILSTGKNKHIKNVSRVFYYKHKKMNGESVSLRVEYLCGLEVFKEWIPIQSDSSYANQKANTWWFYRCGEKAPKTVDEAISIIEWKSIKGTFKQPKSIQIARVGKYDQIINYTF